MDDLDLGATIKGFSPGQKVFNRYSLKKILGRGGMGVVWLARDEELERDVALKFLPEIVAMDREAIRDLKRETRRSLDLTHPHIVRIYDFIQDTRTAAISMEYVAGDTLAARKIDQARGCFDPVDLREWVKQLCEALDYAHGKALIVHRDLKPANLMIDARGDLKITDFGIAASVSDSVSRASANAASSGSPPYMSPQQLDGRPTSPSDDIYALGATLYELLTGKPPFYSGGIAAIINQIKTVVPPSVAERRKELGVEAAGSVPPEWEETIAACLAKEAQARPQSAGEVAERLGLGNGGSALAPTVKRPIPHIESDLASAVSNHGPKKSRTAIYAGIAAVVIVLAGAGYYFGLHVPTQEAERAQEAARKLAETQAIESRKTWEALQAWIRGLDAKRGVSELSGAMWEKYSAIPADSPFLNESRSLLADFKSRAATEEARAAAEAQATALKAAADLAAAQGEERAKTAWLQLQAWLNGLLPSKGEAQLTGLPWTQFQAVVADERSPYRAEAENELASFRAQVREASRQAEVKAKENWTKLETWLGGLDPTKGEAALSGDLWREYQAVMADEHSPFRILAGQRLTAFRGRIRDEEQLVKQQSSDIEGKNTAPPTKALTEGELNSLRSERALLGRSLGFQQTSVVIDQKIATVIGIPMVIYAEPSLLREGRYVLLPSDRPVKLAIVDVAKIYDSDSRTIAQNTALRNEEAEAQAQIESLNRQGNQLVDEYKELLAKSKDMSFSAPDRAQAEKAAQLKLDAIQDKKKVISEFAAATQNRLQEKLRDFRANMLATLTREITRRLKVNGVELVLDRSGPSTFGVSPIVYTSTELREESSLVAKVLRVGVVDLARLYDGHPKTGKENTALRAEETEAQKQIDAMNVAGKALVDKYSALMKKAHDPKLTHFYRSEASQESQVMLEQIQMKKEEIADFATKKTAGLQRRLQEFRERLLIEVSVQVGTLAGQRGLDLVFDTAGLGVEGLSPLFTGPALTDLTAEVERRIK
jgi:Skp family chaperone for outer membrane proteins